MAQETEAEQVHTLTGLLYCSMDRSISRIWCDLQRGFANTTGGAAGRKMRMRRPRCTSEESHLLTSNLGRKGQPKRRGRIGSAGNGLTVTSRVPDNLAESSLTPCGSFCFVFSPGRRVLIGVLIFPRTRSLVFILVSLFLCFDVSTLLHRADIVLSLLFLDSASNVERRLTSDTPRNNLPYYLSCATQQGSAT